MKLDISAFQNSKREKRCVFIVFYIFFVFIYSFFIYLSVNVSSSTFEPGITQLIMKLVLKAMGSSFLSSDLFTSYRKLWKLMWEVCCRYLLRSETQNQIIPEVVILIALLLIPNEKSTIFEFVTFFHVDDQFSWNHPFFFSW